MGRGHFEPGLSILLIPFHSDQFYIIVIDITLHVVAFGRSFVTTTGNCYVHDLAKMYAMCSQGKPYYMAIIWQSGLDVETVKGCVFLFSKASVFKTSMARVPDNKLLTNLAS